MTRGGDVCPHVVYLYERSVAHAGPTFLFDSYTLAQ